MTPTSTTLASGIGEHRWIEQPYIDAYLMANDRYRDNQTTAIAAAGVLASALVVLGAGALHPVVLYLIIAASGVITVIFGLLTWREFTRRKEAKAKMEAAAVTTPFQMFLTVTPGSSANVTYRDPGRPSSAAVP